MKEIGSDASRGAPSAGVAQQALAHVDALYAYAHYLARDAQRAEDLVQETFARCIAGAHGFIPGTALKAWLFRILRNTFIDQKRRDAKSPIRADQDLDSSLDLGDGSLEPLRSEHGVEQLRGLVAAEIAAAVRGLPEIQRSVILLDMEGFSESEMADVLSCAPGTIKSRLARARAALRVQLKEYAK